MLTSLSKFLLVLGVVIFLQSVALSQVFLAKAVFEDFFVEEDIVQKMQQAGYKTLSSSDLPDEIAQPAKKLTNYLDEQIGKTKKLYYLNESDGSVLICGVETKGGYFAYAANYFFGNENAVERIREIFTENDLTFDHEENGLYYYLDGEDAGGLIGILDNGIVMFGYFEP